MFVHICMLTQVNELLITQLHIFSINFINVLICIRYLVFPALFQSISMVFIDYTCKTSVTEYRKSVRLLLKWFKVLYCGRLHYFSGPCYVCYPKNSIKHSSYVSNKPCLYLFACWHRFMYFFWQGLPIFSIHLINALGFNCYVCYMYQMIHKLFLVSVWQLLTAHL